MIYRRKDWRWDFSISLRRSSHYSRELSWLAQCPRPQRGIPKLMRSSKSSAVFRLQSVLFNYGSFDPFAAVDLGLTSQKRGRSPAMLGRERSILDQVQVRSILRLILPEMVAQNEIK